MPTAVVLWDLVVQYLRLRLLIAKITSVADATVSFSAARTENDRDQAN
jgi:hypothetical protein